MFLNKKEYLKNCRDLCINAADMYVYNSFFFIIFHEECAMDKIAI